MSTVLKEGDKAPAFSGLDQNGNKVALKDFKGKKLALYFYPQDGTPTCTVQACNLRDHYPALQKAGYDVVGVSPDDVQKHKKFETKHELPFTLIADTSHEILEKYGVWGEKMLYGRKYMGVMRTTFLIDEKGKIERIIAKPKSKEHASEIL
jgi:peroxiredoxin Q/BCP